MNFQSRYTLQVATEADVEAINELYAANGFSGKVSVQFLRNPNPFLSLAKDGDEAVVFILRDTLNNGQPAGMGACIIRSEYVGGEVKRIGYLTGLKIMPDYRHKVGFIPHGYELIKKQTKNKVDLYYNTLLKENHAVRAMFEKNHAGMPVYRSCGEYTVFLFSTTQPVNNRNSELVLECGITEELQVFYHNQMPAFDFSPVKWDAFHIPDENFFHLHDKSGTIVAACVVWNQQQHKQYVISGYSGFYKLAPFLPLKRLGYPQFPKSGKDADYLSILLLRVKNNDAALAEILIRKIAVQFRQHDFLMIGLHETNPFVTIFTRIRHFKYQSILYTVTWNGREGQRFCVNRPIGLEVGLL